MKKLFMTIIILFIIYLGIEFAFRFFGKGNEWSYQIKKNSHIFDVEEISTLKVKDNDDNYFMKVKTPNRTFVFQTYADFSRSSHIIQDLEYYQDDQIECLLPIFKGKKILMDMMCYHGENLTYYHNIKGQNNNLDTFVAGIEAYDNKQFVDSATSEVIEKINVYRDNLIKDHYIGITNYMGIYDVSKNFNSVVYKIDLYKNDVYSQKLGVYADEFYISADYNAEYEFTKFNLVDLVHLDTDSITSNKKISLDSYIQGVVDGKVYLYDKDNKKQYEINVAKKTVVEVGSNGNIKNYVNGEWTTMTESQANNELPFLMTPENDYTNAKYTRVDKIGDTIGYYYLYQKTDAGYIAYRKNMQDDTIYEVFTTKTIDHIAYVGNYIYFIDGNTVKVYHDSFGVKQLITYSELEFNKSIHFHVHIG